MIRFLISALIYFFLQSTSALENEVGRACGPIGAEMVKLEFRNQKHNLSNIKKSKLESNETTKYLKQFYKGDFGSKSEADILTAASQGNLKLVPSSKIKDLFMKFSTKTSRLEDPVGYKSSLIKAIDDLVPKEFNKLDWLLSLKDPIIAAVTFRPSSAEETGEVYGAVTRINKVEDSKYEIEIVFSNNESEPIPYLIPLIVHEIQHAVTYKEKSKIKTTEDYYKFLIVEEAKAFDTQMSVYLDLAKAHPELFCNWLYPTWAYGDLLVPLSWTMAAMEQQMKAGTYIYNYAKLGEYKDKSYLLNPDGTDLAADLKTKIKNLNLKYVK